MLMQSEEGSRLMLAIPRAAPETRWYWESHVERRRELGPSAVRVEIHVPEIRLTRAELEDAARFWRELAAELRRHWSGER